MSTGGKRGITSPEQGNAGLNLGPELRSAFDVPISALTRPEEERILSDLPLEEITEQIKTARQKFGGSVTIRQQEDGTIIVSPNSKRRRIEVRDEEGSKSENVSADLPEGEDKVQGETSKGKRKVETEEEAPAEVAEIVFTPEETARASFVQRVRDAISYVLPQDREYRISDMGDVNFDTRYHGLHGSEELPVQFKYQRYPGIASFMDPAQYQAPYITIKGDLLFFKRHERGLPVLEFLLGVHKKGYWAALCFVPKKCRSIVWQETEVSKLPVDQLFRIVPLTKVDWHLTMQQQTAVDEVQLRNYYDLWERVSRKFSEDIIPKPVVRVLTHGLTLSEKNIPKEEPPKEHNVRPHPPKVNFETEEASFEEELIPLEANLSNKPVVEYKQLFSVVSKTEKTISGVLKDQTIIKNTLKEHSKVLDAISTSILTFKDPKTFLSSLGTASGGKIKDLEAEVRGLKTSVASLVTVCKEIQSFNQTLVDKIDAVIQDKSRLSWDEFSQRQRDILTLNQHLANPMQPPRWPGVSAPGPTMGTYMEGVHTGGQISASGMPIAYGGGPTLSGSALYPLQGLNPSLGGPTHGLAGVVAPIRSDEKQEPPLTAPTQDPAPTASSHQGASNDELVRLLLQQLQSSKGAQK